MNDTQNAESSESPAEAEVSDSTDKFDSATDASASDENTSELVAASPSGGRAEADAPQQAPSRTPLPPKQTPIRLQKILAQAGVASRRASENLITQGRVEINGKIVREMGIKVDPARAIIRVDGTRIMLDDTLIHLVLNKPRGMHSTMSDEMRRPCIGDLLADRIDAGQRLFHVGRLDADTEGLILITNDGELGHRLMHPSYQISKTYMATVTGVVAKGATRALRGGIELDDGPAKADDIKVIDSHDGRSLVRITLHEGRKHIVRRMFEAVDHPVEQLVRTNLGGVYLGEQRPGTLRKLNRLELSNLYAAVNL